jgi:hypothetical protein
MGFNSAFKGLIATDLSSFNCSLQFRNQFKINNFLLITVRLRSKYVINDSVVAGVRE